MKISRFNPKLTTITLVLLLTLSAFIIALPAVSAQATGKAYPFIEAIPDTVGVGQVTLLNTGALNFLNTAADGWNVTIRITDPSGTTTDLGPFKTFSTGTWGQAYIPEQVGTYQIQTIFPQQTYAGVTYLAAESNVVELVVQEEAIPTYPDQPLPNEYWYRPIDSQLRSWWQIAGSWDTRPNNLYAPYNAAPQSPHVLWRVPIGDTQQGLVGGFIGNHAMDDGDAYEGKLSGSIIINGIFYYNKQPGFFGGGIKVQTVVAVDMHTGEVIWEKQFPYGDGRVDYGQIFYWDSINNRGAHTYLWFTSGGYGAQTWYAVEPLTGEPRYNMTNVPSGTIYRGPNGEFYIYQITNYGNTTNPNWRLLRWSSSKTVIGEGGGSFLSESWAPNVANAQYDATRGYDMNVSITGLTGSLPGSMQTVFVGDKVIGARVNQEEVDLWAISLLPGHEGALLYNTVWNAPAEWVEGNITTGGIGQAGWVSFSEPDQVGVFFTKENVVHYAFDLTNGQYMYQTEPQTFVDAWSDTVSATFGPDRIIVHGKLISATVGGIVYCYDVQTGTRLWTYEANDPYGESYISNNWWIIPLFATDDAIYFGSLEHSALDPKPRGAPFFALDYDGNVIFRADGMFRQTRWGGRAMIGDSIIVGQNTYDQMVYGIGKGPSEITVSAPNSDGTAGSFVLLTGSVTDVSPGTQVDTIMARFPKGVPAVADESMTDWMLYVYSQFAQPEEVTGVTVYLSVITPSGELINLGNAETNKDGSYGYSFIPQEEGMYTVTAKFEGTASYYGSEATTYMYVNAAPTPASPMEPEQPTPTEPTPEQPTPEEPTPEQPTPEQPTPEEPEPTVPEHPLISAELAIVIAVVAACIIGAVAYIALRRRQ